MTSWDSGTYLKFRSERNRPALDLLARLGNDFSSILDLGCGPGNSTALLHERYPVASLLGVDADDGMLARAVHDQPGLHFEKALIPNDFHRLGTFDLIFSNACIHWIPDQARLIREAFDHLAPGGTFAVQIPMTSEAPFHRDVKNAVLSQKKWECLRMPETFHSLDAYGYYDALSKFTRDVVIWRTDYHHLMNSPREIVAWYSGSGLRPFLDRLDSLGMPGRKEEFMDDIEHEIEKKYRRLADGAVVLIMPRLFFIAVRQS